MAGEKRILVFIGPEPREFPGFGIFGPGDEVDYNETLAKSNLFKPKTEEKPQKEGDK